MNISEKWNIVDIMGHKCLKGNVFYLQLSFVSFSRKIYRILAPVSDSLSFGPE